VSPGPGFAPIFLLLLAGPTPEVDSVSYSEASLEFEGTLLDHRFIDVDGSGQMSLCVALRLPTGRRELRVLRPSRRGFDPTSARSVSILEDVVAYGFADVRSEPGDELLFLTRTGAYSYSLSKDGYRGNIARLATEELIYDVPDSRALPFWAYTLKVTGGDQVLLPGRSDFAIWGPISTDVEGADPYGPRVRFGAPGPVESREAPAKEGGRSTTSRSGSGEIRVELDHDSNILFLSGSESSSTLLEDGKSYSSPALVDLNGDGRRDLVLQRESELLVFISGPDGVPRKPTRVEPLPDYLLAENVSTKLEFVDLDGDGDLDLLAQIEQNVDGFENAEMRVLVLLNDGRRLLPAEAQQVLRFEAAMLRATVTDVDADGRPDLLVRKFVLPSMLETVSGLQFELSYLAFLGSRDKDRPFERKPALKQVEIFDENNFADAVKSRRIELDCSGDGVPDLVELDLHGRIVIRRLVHESGFFSGDTWRLDATPWKRFETRGTAMSLEVLDLNGDGLADIVSPSGNSLTMFLSSRVR
jgi:hypothetical protein